MKRIDPVLHDEARHDRRTFAGAEQAQELAQEQLEQEMDAVWDEVLEGEHDREIFQSSYVDTELMCRVGRISACGYGKQFAPAIPAIDLNDLKLQITDYVEDCAKMRLER
jgi:hypothetical protein